MSHDHLPTSKDSHVEGMPSINETVNPEGRFQFDPALGVSTQQAEAARKKKRNRLIAGATTTAIILTGGAFVAGKSLGGGETKSRSNQTTSASLDPTPTPTEAESVAPTPPPEFILNLDSSDPLAAKGALSNQLSDLVNARLNGGPKDASPDLSYLATSEGIGDVQSFTSQAVDKIWEAEKASGMQDLSIGIVIGEPTSVKPLDNGGFVVVADTTYLAISPSGDPLGYASGNSETYAYEFTPVTYVINDEEVNTYAVNGIEEVELKP